MTTKAVVMAGAQDAPSAGDEELEWQYCFQSRGGGRIPGRFLSIQTQKCATPPRCACFTGPMSSPLPPCYAAVSYRLPPLSSLLSHALRPPLAFVNAFIFMEAWSARRLPSGRDYRDIFPRKKDLSLLPRYLRYQLFFSSKEPAFSKYNPVQKLYFTAWLPLFILQALTGLILYASRRLGRLEAVFGGLGRTRKIHHLAAVLQGVTALTHIFFTATAGTEKLKSMFTGYKALGKK